MKKPNAYTIIEVLVALSILGLIFVAGYANFRDFSRRQVLTSSQRSLSGDLRLAQDYALIGKKPDDAKCTGVNILDSYGFFVVSATEYVIRAYCTGGAIAVKDVSLPADIEISTPSPNPIKFKVLGEGLDISADVILTLTQLSTGKTTTVTVTKGGEIK